MQPPPLIESRVGVVVKALNFPGGGTPIWNRRGCSSEILNLTWAQFLLSMWHQCGPGSIP